MINRLIILAVVAAFIAGMVVVASTGAYTTSETEQVAQIPVTDGDSLLTIEQEIIAAQAPGEGPPEGDTMVVRFQVTNPTESETPLEDVTIAAGGHTKPLTGDGTLAPGETEFQTIPNLTCQDEVTVAGSSEGLFISITESIDCDGD